MKQIIQKILKGDKKAYKAVIKEFGPGIRAFFGSHLNSFTEVDDLSQEVFLSAYENLDSFDVESDFKTWLKGIAWNKLNMHLRREYTRDNIMFHLRNRVAELASDNENEYSTLTTRQAVHRLRECLKKLPGKFKKIVEFRYLQNIRVKNIARKVSMTVSAVSVILFRSRKMLKSCMSEERTDG